MDIKIIEEANKLAEELKGLREYQKLLDDREHKNNVHFEIRQHYGGDHINNVIINKRHNKRFLNMVDSIIYDLEMEIEKL